MAQQLLHRGGLTDSLRTQANPPFNITMHTILQWPLQPLTQGLFWAIGGQKRFQTCHPTDGQRIPHFFHLHSLEGLRSSSILQHLQFVHHQLESSLQKPVKCLLKIVQKVSTSDQYQEVPLEAATDHLLGDPIPVRHLIDLLHHHHKDNHHHQGENFQILTLPFQALGHATLFQVPLLQVQFRRLAPQY